MHGMQRYHKQRTEILLGKISKRLENLSDIGESGICRQVEEQAYKMKTMEECIQRPESALPIWQSVSSCMVAPKLRSRA